jgi:dTDP-4-dehydrorhamnose reductase
MNIIILGSTGLLGNMLFNYFSGMPNYKVSSSIRNLKFKTDTNFLFDPLVNTISELPDADYFINAIGIIKPHMFPNLANSIYINSIFPRELADECERRGSKLFHITSDCCLSGKDGNYDEDSPHDALDEYGKSKSLGEPDNCMVLRTSIIGPEIHKNASLVSWVLSQKGKEIKGFTNHLWNGITTLQYAKICDQIILNDWYDTDIFHLFSPNIVNKFELVSMINAKYKVGATITPITVPERIDRTLNSKKNLCSKLNIPEILDQILELPTAPV